MGTPETPGEPENPWLNGLIIGAVLSMFAGVMLYGSGISSQSRFDDRSLADYGRRSGQILAGVGFVGLGGWLLIAWLTASAICWQLRLRPC